MAVDYRLSSYAGNNMYNRSITLEGILARDD